MKILHAALILTATFCLAALGVLFLEARADLKATIAKANAAFDEAATTSIEERQKFDAELKEVRKVTADFHDLLVHTDLNLNGTSTKPGMLPRLNRSVNDELVPQIATNLRDLDSLETQTIKDFAATMTRLAPTLDALAQLAADPNIKQSIVNLELASRDLDLDLKQLHDMLESGAATAKDVQRVADKVAYEYTKARNLFYLVFKETLSIGAQGVQFFLKK